MRPLDVGEEHAVGHRRSGDVLGAPAARRLAAQSAAPRGLRPRGRPSAGAPRRSFACRARALLSSSLAALAVALALPAAAQVRSTIIGPGVKRFPIAVPPLKAGAAASDQFARVLARDLDLSGLFRIIPSDTYIDDAQASGVTAESINFDNWSVIGALALVKGTAERSGDDLTIEARLFDVALHKQLAGRRFHGRAADEGRMANRFADEIIQYFTGERGPFDSAIAFLS